MTNASLKAILAEYGKKAKAIHCANFSIQINQSFSGIKPVTNEDIVYKTYGDEDFFIVPMYDAHNKKYFDALVKTSMVESVNCTRNENDALDMYYV